MWFRHRFRRLKRKLLHLQRYFETLRESNEIERLTDFSKSKRPVLVLYGFGATRRSLSILESRLREDDFDVFSINLGGLLDLFNTRPIDHLAEYVAEKIARLKEKHGFPKIGIIGYSKGGLIGRYYISNLDGANYVHTLITLATPHQGNPWAFWSTIFLGGLFSRGIRQMVPTSPFLKDLANAPIPESVYAVSIFSTHDRTCPPRYSALKINNESANNICNICLSDLHHSDFVIKNSAYEKIRDSLEKGFNRAETKPG